MNTKPVFHGSDIEKICDYYHLKKENIINFGANVNPLGLSLRVKEQLASHLDLFSSYPDREYRALRHTISNYCHIPADYILPGNGSSELISLLIEERSPKHTLDPGPYTYPIFPELAFSNSTQEYYHLQESSNFVLDIDNLCQTLEKGYDFLILCNPNNPTSSAVTQKDLNNSKVLRKKRYFCDRSMKPMWNLRRIFPKYTAVPLTMEFQNLMVLRGVSKFFAAPGMRLGYGITGNKSFLSQMKEKQVPWSLNSLAAFAGELLFQDKEYIQNTRNLILSEREKMYQELQKLSTFQVYPAYANFLPP